MIITVHEATNRINKYHSSFAGHTTEPKMTNPRAYDAIMRAFKFLENDPAAKSVNFDAVLDDGTETVITITLVDGSLGYVDYIERTAGGIKWDE